MPTLMSMFAHDNDQHEPLLASLSNTIIHAPGGNPLLSSHETQSTLLIRLGDYLNILRHNSLHDAMNLEREMVRMDEHNLHVQWRETLIEKYKKFNPNFPDNFKIKVIAKACIYSNWVNNLSLLIIVQNYKNNSSWWRNNQ